MSCAYVVLRGALFHFRIRVPNDLVSALGRRELCMSLGEAAASSPQGDSARNKASLRVIRDRADHHAVNLRPVLDSLSDEGIVSLGHIADALNERGMLTPRGGSWHKSSMRNLIARLDAVKG